MGFDQYHEPAEELSADAHAKALMAHARGEELKHFGTDLGFLLRRTPKWRIAPRGIPFWEGDIVELGEAAEDAENS
jgi:hypothetical protein